MRASVTVLSFGFTAEWCSPLIVHGVGVFRGEPYHIKVALVGGTFKKYHEFLQNSHEKTQAKHAKS